MSHTQSIASSSNFQLIFDNALEAYKKRTKNDLLVHPLAFQLQACDSPATILALLYQQLQELNESRNYDERLLKWLEPTVNILHAISAALGEGVGLIFSPAKVVFAGVGVLLLAVKDVRASQDALADIFERIESFFRRLELYIEVPMTTEMMGTIIQIVVEMLSILGIATKEIKDGRTKKYVKRLFFRRTDLEDALKRLDKLTHEEVRMATAEVLKLTHTVNKRVEAVDDKITVVIDHGNEAKEAMRQTASNLDHVKQNQLRGNIHKWLSPSDPSTNHNIARGTHHRGTSAWFFEGSIFREWKTTGSLLWVHGKPGSGKSILWFVGLSLIF